MKTRIFTPVIVGVLLASFTGAMGQAKTEKEKQEEAARKKTESVIVIDGKKIDEHELQKELQEIRKLHEADQIKIQKQAMDEYRKTLEELKEKGIENAYVLPPSSRWSQDRSYRYNYFTGPDLLYNLSENSSLVISKNLSDVTFSTDFVFDVKTGSSSISFNVNGTMEAGELRIKMKRPDSDVFQEIVVSPLADVDWTQNYRWEEEDEDEFLGRWTISIQANQASGEYNLRINSR